MLRRPACPWACLLGLRASVREVLVHFLAREPEAPSHPTSKAGPRLTLLQACSAVLGGACQLSNTAQGKVPGIRGVMSSLCCPTGHRHCLGGAAAVPHSVSGQNLSSSACFCESILLRKLLGEPPGLPGLTVAVTIQLTKFSWQPGTSTGLIPGSLVVRCSEGRTNKVHRQSKA